MRLSHQLLGALAASALVGARIDAQNVPFVGTTSGCFYFASGPCTQSRLGLGYQTGAFDTYTDASGFLGIGGFFNDPNNLGAFTLNSAANNYNGTSFVLNVIFAMPTLANATTVFSAAIKGSVQHILNGKLAGGVRIDFDNTPQIFLFNGPQYAGSFSFSVDDVTLNPNTQAPVGGVIQATATPEPATMLLLATGIAGLIPAERRRRNRRKQTT